ncbi:MAG: MFS transporter [Gemmatimonadota bacterium]
MTRLAPRESAVLLVALATFTDLLAYAVAVPVLPDLATRLGASPTEIGLLFGSFGLSLLAVSVPMGAVSDRVGRRTPLIAAMVALAGATWMFAGSASLPALLAGRLVQGAADAVTWSVGLALVADLYGPAERGRVMGLVMSATGLGIVLGPPLGGWLYELGGVRLPFLTVSLLAAALAVGFLFLPLPPPAAAAGRVPLARVLRNRELVACAAAAVAGSATIAMLEPVLPLHFDERLGLSPGGVGLLFGCAAVASTLTHPLWGRLSDRRGGRRLMLLGLALSALLLPLLALPAGALAAAAVMVALWPALGMTITPALALMGDAASRARLESFGVVYGLYNVAWGVGLLGGPAAGGFLLERLGFATLLLAWSPALLACTLAIAVASRDSRAVAGRPGAA